MGEELHAITRDDGDCSRILYPLKGLPTASTAAVGELVPSVIALRSMYHRRDCVT